MSERIKVGRGTVYLRHRTYWLEYRENGERIRKNLGVHDLAVAVEKARLILGDGNEPVQTIEDAYRLYLKDYGEKNRASSLQRLKDTLPRFLACAKVRFPHEIARAHVKTFKDQRAVTCSPATVNSDISRVRAFCNWLRAEKLLKEDPTFKIGRLKEKGTRTARGLTEDEIERQLDHLDREDFYRDWYIVGLATGLRPGEEGHLRSCDYESEARILQAADSKGAGESHPLCAPLRAQPGQGRKPIESLVNPAREWRLRPDGLRSRQSPFGVGGR